tara:strand:+ start:580 stop:1089 length:510 start_codon:yes stop_codon:yes gene_type:complete
MIEFKLKDRRMRLIDDVFYARAFSRLGIETKKEKWSKVSFSNSHGYLICNLIIDKLLVRIVQHRLVWYAHHQDWDIWDTSRDNSIDHKNQNKKDNRIANLRPATHSENKQNRDVKGCNFDKRSNKWRARIKLNGKEKHIGYYDTEEEAHEAYLAEKRILHPYFVENEEL